MYLKQKKKKNQKKANFFKYIENESKGINYDLFKNYFNFVAPTVLPKKKILFETKDKKKNNDFEELIQVKWSNLKDEIEKMSKEEIENEKQDKILKILKKSLILIKKFKNNQDKD